MTPEVITFERQILRRYFDEAYNYAQIDMVLRVTENRYPDLFNEMLNDLSEDQKIIYNYSKNK